jgi:hypothetical protein
MLCLLRWDSRENGTGPIVANAFGYLMRTMPVLAAVAALVLAVLPMGLVPRKAGACGRSLCLCPHQITPATPATPFKSPDATLGSECPFGGCGTKTESQTVYVFDGPAMDSHVPPTVFQPVFTALGCVPLQAVILQAGTPAPELAPQYRGLPPAQLYAEVSTPPPRA